MNQDLQLHFDARGLAQWCSSSSGFSRPILVRAKRKFCRLKSLCGNYNLCGWWL